MLSFWEHQQIFALGEKSTGSSCFVLLSDTERGQHDLNQESLEKTIKTILILGENIYQTLKH